jgi:signal transduction histidine kinase
MKELFNLPPGQDQSELPPRHEYKFMDRYLDRVTAPVWSAQDRSFGWLIVIRDMTEEYNIQQARELITQTLVHDMRTPVGVIKGALDLLQEDLSENTDELIEKTLEIAQRSTIKVLGLIESLLDISLLESGNLELNLEETDLTQIVQETIISFSPEAAENKIELKAEMPEKLPLAYVDQNLIPRVLQNLVDNALKFAPENGHTTISIEDKQGGYLTISVADDGPGIPVEFREKVFERFSQIPGSKSRRRGSGLGLTFCRLAVEAHGGRIWIDSGKNGGGTVISFLLPLGKKAES